MRAAAYDPSLVFSMLSNTTLDNEILLDLVLSNGTLSVNPMELGLPFK